MEREHLKQYEGLYVTIRLGNGYNYKGVILQVTKTDVVFQDRLQGKVVMSNSDVMFIGLADDDGYMPKI